MSSYLPTNKAIYDYIDAQGYISEVDDKWTDALNMLSSMLSEENLSVYVDQARGNDSNPGTVDNPIKSLSQAKRIANKRRFVGNAQCNIYIIGEYEFTLNNAGTAFSNGIEFDHPDMINSKYMHVYGYNNNSLIKVNFTGVQTLYLTPIYHACNVHFHDISIKSVYSTVPLSTLTGGQYLGTYTEATNSINAMKCYQDKIQFIYDATMAGSAIHATGNKVRMTNVSFEGFRWAYVGNGTINNASFKDCTLCLTSRGDVIDVHNISVDGACEKVV